MIRDIIFNNVVLPAPFFPIIPRISPCFISRLISLSAHTRSDPLELCALELDVTSELGSSFPRKRAQAEAISFVNIPVEIVPKRYFLARFFISITLDKLIEDKLVGHFKVSLMIGIRSSSILSKNIIILPLSFLQEELYTVSIKSFSTLLNTIIPIVNMMKEKNKE